MFTPTGAARSATLRAITEALKAGALQAGETGEIGPEAAMAAGAGGFAAGRLGSLPGRQTEKAVDQYLLAMAPGARGSGQRKALEAGAEPVLAGMGMRLPSRNLKSLSGKLKKFTEEAGEGLGDVRAGTGIQQAGAPIDDLIDRMAAIEEKAAATGSPELLAGVKKEFDELMMAARNLNKAPEDLTRADLEGYLRGGHRGTTIYKKGTPPASSEMGGRQAAALEVDAAVRRALSTQPNVPGVPAEEVAKQLYSRAKTASRAAEVARLNERFNPGGHAGEVYGIAGGSRALAGAGTAGAIGGGALLGPGGAVAGAGLAAAPVLVIRFLRSPLFRTTSAATRYKLARLVEKGHWDKAASVIGRIAAAHAAPGLAGDEAIRDVERARQVESFQLPGEEEE
jgi:hypothetical protein